MIRLTAIAAIAVFAAGCSGDLSPLREAYLPGGPKPKAVEAPGFVADSRASAEREFLPVGVSAPPRSVRAKSSEGTKALAAELEGARGANEAKGRAAESAGRATKPATAAQ